LQSLNKKLQKQASVMYLQQADFGIAQELTLTTFAGFKF
jgi:hypothetical protein